MAGKNATTIRSEEDMRQFLGQERANAEKIRLRDLRTWYQENYGPMDTDKEVFESSLDGDLANDLWHAPLHHPTIDAR